MTEDECLADLAGTNPSVGAAQWALFVVGPSRALPVVDAHRPFGDDLGRWLRRLAGLPAPADADSEPSTPAHRALVAMRDARTAAPGSPERLAQARALLEGSADRLGLAFCALQLAEEHAHRGDFDVAERWGRQAELDHDDPVVRALARALRSNVAVQQGLPDVAQALAQDATSGGPPGTPAAGLVAMRCATVAQYAGHDGLDRVAEAVAAFEACGARAMALQARAFLARALVVHGRCQEAVAVVRAAGAVPEGLGPTFAAAEGSALLGLGRLRAAQERLADAVLGLPTGDQTRWLAAAGELAAGTWLGETGGPGARLAAELPTLLSEDLPGTQLMLHLTRRWAHEVGPRGLVARARVLDDVELLAAAAGLRADQALSAGDLDAAARWLDEADAAATRGGYALRRRRNARTRARLALLRGDPGAVAALRELVEVASTSGDVLGEALASALLAEALAPTDPRGARDAVDHSLALSSGWGIERGRASRAWLAAVLGGPIPSSPPEDPVARLYAAGAALVAGGDVPAGARALDSAVAALAGPIRAHHTRIVAAALEANGLRWRAAQGSTVVILHDPPEVWLDGEPLGDLGRARIQHRLLRAVASLAEGWSREDLFEAVWEQRYRPPSSDNALHVALGRLRKRLGDKLSLGVDDGGRVSWDAALGLMDRVDRR